MVTGAVALSPAARIRPVLDTRVPSAADDGCTSPDHSDHRTDVRRVHYRWHPLYGQDVVVVGKIGGSRGVYRCQLPDDGKHASREIPIWMFDRVLCSRMKSTPQPHVCWPALVDLKRLLEEIRQTEGSGLIEDRFQPTREESDATSTGPTPCLPDRALRDRDRSAELAGAAGPDSGNGDVSGGSAALGAEPAKTDETRKGGGA